MKMNWPCVLLLLTTFSPLALAQAPTPSGHVLPQPAIAGEPLEAWVAVGTPGCPLLVTSINVTHVGNQVIIDFEVDMPTEPVVCTLPPPLFFRTPIGEFPAGQYELVLNSTVEGTAADPVIIPFGVSPAAVSVPVGGLTSSLLLLLMLGLGVYVLRKPPPNAA